MEHIYDMLQHDFIQNLQRQWKQRLMRSVQKEQPFFSPSNYFQGASKQELKHDPTLG